MRSDPGESRSSARSVRKILIVKLGSLGDIIHTVPAQQEMLRHFSEAEVHWLTEQHYAPLVDNIRGVSKVWVADTRGWRSKISFVGEVVRLVRDLRREEFDVALDFQGLIKSAILARLSGASQVVGFSREKIKESAATYFYTQTVLGDDGSRPHVIQINFQLAQFLGCNADGLSPAMPLFIPEEVQARVENQLAQMEVEDPILISPGAGWVTKRWSTQKFGRLAVETERRLGIPVIVTYGPGEEPLVDRIRMEAAPYPISSLPTTLLELAALCRVSRLLIGGDTGPLHLAVALGLPTVAILGPTAPWRNGPFNPEDEIVTHDQCSNSYRRKCPELVCRCMDMSVQEVFDAVRSRLSR